MNNRVWTIHVSTSPERVYSFPMRELTDGERSVFDSICQMLILAISQLPKEEEKLELTLPSELGVLSEEIISQTFNWLKFNNWKPLIYDDYFRRLSALRLP